MRGNTNWAQGKLVRFCSSSSVSSKGDNSPSGSSQGAIVSVKQGLLRWARNRGLILSANVWWKRSESCRSQGKRKGSNLYPRLTWTWWNPEYHYMLYYHRLWQHRGQQCILRGRYGGNGIREDVVWSLSGQRTEILMAHWRLPKGCQSWEDTKGKHKA